MSNLASASRDKSFNQLLRKSKSMFCLVDQQSLSDATDCQKDEFCGYRRSHSRTISESSIDIYVVLDSDSDSAPPPPVTSTFDGEMHMIEQKIDRLSDMFLEQCRLLTTLKEDIRSSKEAMEKVDLAQSDILANVLKNTVLQSSNLVKPDPSEETAEGNTNTRARSLLAAIEARSELSVDAQIRDTLTNFLQSDELCTAMAWATAERVRGAVGAGLSRDLAALCAPQLEREHRALRRHLAQAVEDAFHELEENSASLSKTVYKITRSLRRSVERHQSLLEAAADPRGSLMSTFKRTVEETLQSEMKQWRQQVLDVFSEQLQPAPQPETVPEPDTAGSAPLSPPQPANPDISIIDRLMTGAEVSRQLAAGDANGAFSTALCAGDLAAVTEACRAAPRARLAQPVLLALMQQLSTDMLHDTHLKCRYLEESIINLDPSNPLTRQHLPLVVGEVRKHLTKFLSSYPSHFASKRIALIIMAADNLLK